MSELPMSEIAFLVSLLALVAANMAVRVLVARNPSGMPPLPAEH